jgi:hypothetical protein
MSGTLATREYSMSLYMDTETVAAKAEEETETKNNPARRKPISTYKSDRRCFSSAPGRRRSAKVWRAEFGVRNALTRSFVPASRAGAPERTFDSTQIAPMRLAEKTLLSRFGPFFQDASKSGENAAFFSFGPPLVRSAE